MTRGRTAVVGIYSGRSMAENAVAVLKTEGFRGSDISILTPCPSGLAGAGGILGCLAGISAIGIPGVGSFVAAGPIMPLLAGITRVGTAPGGISRALVGLGVSEHAAEGYEGFVRDGRTLISIDCDDAEWAVKAKKDLEETGATDVSSSPDVNEPYLRHASGG